MTSKYPQVDTDISTKISTSFHIQLAIALSLAGVSFLFALTSISYNYSLTNSTAISNSNTNSSPTPTPTATPTPTPSPETGCCSFICENQWDGGPDEPAGKEVPKCVQTTEDKCSCSSYEVQTACTGSLGDGYACKNPVWHKGQQCNVQTGQCEDIPKKGCCSVKDNWGNGIACHENMEEDDCEALGGEFDDQCIVCDEITNTCRDELCCQCDDAQGKFCSEVSSAQECLEKGCKPSRGNCNQKTGQCEPTGCCEFPSDQCSGPVTASVCSEQGGAWNAQGTCNSETGKCEKLGCCQSPDQCTQSTQDECPDNLLWIEKAECNYSTGKCEASSELKMTVDIKPDVQEYLHPRSDEDLTCYGRVENYAQEYNLVFTVSGVIDQSFLDSNGICGLDEDPCVFAISIPHQATVAGARVECAMTAIHRTTLQTRTVADTTTVQMCVFLGAPPVPKESGTRKYIDLVMVPDLYADGQYRDWKSATERIRDFVFSKAPFRTRRGSFRVWRNDWMRPDGKGEPLNCSNARLEDNIVACQIDRAKELAQGCPFDRGMVVINSQGFRAFAVPLESMAITPGVSPDTALHELGHLFSLGDEYFSDPPQTEYYTFYNIHQEKNDGGLLGFLFGEDLKFVSSSGVPCGTTRGGVFGSDLAGKGWCTGTMTGAEITARIPSTSPCKGLSADACLRLSGYCDPLPLGAGLLPSACAAAMTQPACESLGHSCRWRLQSRCMLYNGTCLDLYENYSIGKDCQLGTGCYPGSAYFGGFRSSEYSIMRHDEVPGESSVEFNTVSRRIINDVISCEVGVAQTACRPFQSSPDVVTAPLNRE